MHSKMCWLNDLCRRYKFITVSYLATTIKIPNDIQIKINEEMLHLVVPHLKTCLKIEYFARKRSIGGYNIDDSSN